MPGLGGAPSCAPALASPTRVPLDTPPPDCYIAFGVLNPRLPPPIRPGGARPPCPLRPQARPQGRPRLLRRTPNLGRLDFSSEGAVSPAFAALLRHSARPPHPGGAVPPQAAQTTIRLDGALLDNFRLAHGYLGGQGQRRRPGSEIHKKFDARLPPRQHPLSGPRPRHHLPGWPARLQCRSPGRATNSWTSCAPSSPTAAAL